MNSLESEAKSYKPILEIVNFTDIKGNDIMLSEIELIFGR